MRYRYMCLLTMVFITSRLLAQEMSLKNVEATIEGSSTLHDWKSTITQIEFLGNLDAENSTPRIIKNIVVTIPVKSIKSKEGKLMDSKTYEAFKADTYPSIVFSVTQASISIDAAKNIIITAPGKLTMAGTTQPVTVLGVGKILTNGDWQISVTQKITMTKFSMKPPTVMMGAIKVGDDVTVSVNLTLTPSGIALKQ